MHAGENIQPATSAQDIQRKHRRAMRCMWASCLALGVSIVTIIASSRPEWSQGAFLLMWNHVLILGLVAFAGLALRRLPRREAGPAVPRPRELLAPWVLALGLLAVVAAASPWRPSIWDLGTTPDGETITSRQTRTSDDGKRFFETLNRGIEREITEADYLANQQATVNVFGRVWAIFSVVALLMWRFIALRWRAEWMAPVEAITIRLPPATPAGSKQSAVIVGLWVLVVGSSLLHLQPPPSPLTCGAGEGLQPPWFVLLLPPIFFGASAWFAKRAPFDAPWLAALVDEKLGVGSYANFLQRLKPMLLIAAGAISSAGVLMAQCMNGGLGVGNNFHAAFALSAGVAFALSHAVMRWRRVPGV